MRQIDCDLQKVWRKSNCPNPKVSSFYRQMLKQKVVPRMRIESTSPNFRDPQEPWKQMCGVQILNNI